MTFPLSLTDKERYKFKTMKLLLHGAITNGEAAGRLGVSPRQVKRMKKAVRQKGMGAVIHQLKGKQGNHKINREIKEEALQQIREKYADFKPGFATEKLVENHAIHVSSDTVLRWMSEEGLWKPRHHKKTGVYRSWRPRKEYYGEMQQFDGSYHDWFEGRYRDEAGGIVEICLLLSVDDATGKITRAWFSVNEGVVAVFQFWKAYILLNGKPGIIYLDKFSTYKLNHKGAEDNKDLMTQFQRACNSLDIHVINANSPEAKGRVERMFQTLQDRLIKEMRLAKINNPEEANIFLTDIFIKKFNEKFAVQPNKEGDVHRAPTTTDKNNLNRIFSRQSVRTINNDFTIQFKNNWHQLAEIQPTTVRARERVTVEEWLDTSLHFTLNGYSLQYQLLPKRPEKLSNHPIILTTHKLNFKPPYNHPWRTSYKGSP